jgi:hypothetical protein
MAKMTEPAGCRGRLIRQHTHHDRLMGKAIHF